MKKVTNSDIGEGGLILHIFMVMSFFNGPIGVVYRRAG